LSLNLTTVGDKCKHTTALYHFLLLSRPNCFNCT